MDKSKVVKGLFWNYVERFGKEGIAFIVSVVLASLVAPEQFGAIAIVNVFIALSNVLVVSGFNTALIQQKEVDNEDVSTVFFSSLTIACGLYAILFISAPAIASFYSMPELKNVLRIFALSLPFGAYNSIQTALLTRKLQFKKQLYTSLIAVTISGCFGIIAAHRGLGIWALVVQSLTSVIVSCIVLQFIVHWRPVLVFSLVKFKKLFSFSWKIVVSSLVDSLYSDIFSLVIGKKYSASDLAYYNRGQQIPLLVSRNITSSISSVMLPVYSKMQDDVLVLKQAVKKSISVCSFVMFPVIMGLFACSKPIILLFYSETWESSVVYMQLFCLAYLFYPVNMANSQALNGMGRSDLFLKLNLIKKGLGLFFLILSIPYGVGAIAIGYAVTSGLNLFINMIPNKKLLDYGIKEQFGDFGASLVLSVVMGAVCFGLTYIVDNNLVLLIVQIVLGMGFYLGVSLLTRNKALFYLIRTIKEMKKAN